MSNGHSPERGRRGPRPGSVAPENPEAAPPSTEQPPDEAIRPRTEQPTRPEVRRSETLFRGKGYDARRYTPSGHEQYHIAVRQGGRWVTFPIDANSHPTIQERDGLFVIQTAPDAAGQRTTMRLDYLPEIVDIPSGQQQMLVDDNQRYRVEQLHITPQGNIEYDLLRLDEHDQVTGRTIVPQEYIRVWRDIARIEDDFQILREQVLGVTEAKEQELHGQRRQIEELLASAHHRLLRFEDMTDRSAAEISQLSQELRELQTTVEQQVRNFRQRIDRELSEDRGPMNYRYNRHVPTKEEYEAQNQQAGRIVRDLARDVERQKQEITEREEERLDEYNEERRRAHDARAAADGRNRGQFKEATQLPARERRDFAEERSRAEREVYQRFYERMQQEIDGNGPLADQYQWVFVEINRRRRRDAESDFAAIDTPEGREYAPGSDLFHEKNQSVLKEVLADAQKSYEERKQSFDETGKRVFDFEAIHETLAARLQSLINLVPIDNGDTPREYEAVFNNLNTLKQRQTQERKELATLEKARRFLNQPDLRFEQLQQLRIDRFRALQSEVNRLEEELLARDRTDQVRRAEEERLRRIAEQREVVLDTINLPAQEIVQLLQGRQPQVQAIMRDLYQGAMQEIAGASQVRQNVVLQLQELFLANRPDEAVLARLRPYGIRSWETFTRLWREKIAGAVAGPLAKMADETMRARLAEYQKTFGAKLEEVGRKKGRLLARIGMTAALVGGGALLATGLVASGGLGGFLAGAAGAAAGGGVRGWLNKKIFGSSSVQKWFQEGDERALGEQRERLANAMLEEQFSGQGQVGMDLFGQILAVTMREQTGGGAGFSQDAVAEVNALSTRDRLIYERALEQLDTRNPSEEQKRQMALLISRIRSNGDMKQEDILKQTDPAVVHALDSLIQRYSGQRGIGAAVASGVGLYAFVRGLDFLDKEFEVLGLNSSQILRGTLGGVFGAIAGYRFAEGWREQRDREQARARLELRLAEVVGATQHMRQHGGLPQQNQHFNYQTVRESLLALKRLLHGTAPREDLAALVIHDVHLDNKSGKKESVVRADEMMIAQIRNTVFEAEHIGLLQERPEDRERMDHLLARLQQNGDAIANHQETTGAHINRWFRKWGTRIGGLVGGAVLGATSSILLGQLIDWGAESVGLRTSPEALERERLAAAMTPAERARLENIWNDFTGEHKKSTTPLPIENPTNSKGSLPEIPALPVENKTTPQVVGEYKFKSNQGWLHGRNALERTVLADPETRADVVRAIKEHHAGESKWERYFGNEKKLLAFWEKEQRIADGFRILDEGQVYSKTIHPGAKLYLIFDKEGYPHMTLDPEQYGVKVAEAMDRVSEHEAKFKARTPVIDMTKNNPINDSQMFHDYQDQLAAVRDQAMAHDRAMLEQYITDPDIRERILQDFYDTTGTVQDPNGYIREVVSQNPYNKNSHLTIRFDDGSGYDIRRLSGNRYVTKFVPDATVEPGTKGYAEIIPEKKLVSGIAADAALPESHRESVNQETAGHADENSTQSVSPEVKPYYPEITSRRLEKAWEAIDDHDWESTDQVTAKNMATLLQWQHSVMKDPDQLARMLQIGQNDPIGRQWLEQHGKELVAGNQKAWQALERGVAKESTRWPDVSDRVGQVEPYAYSRMLELAAGSDGTSALIETNDLNKARFQKMLKDMIKLDYENDIRDARDQEYLRSVGFGTGVEESSQLPSDAFATGMARELQFLEEVSGGHFDRVLPGNSLTDSAKAEISSRVADFDEAIASAKIAGDTAKEVAVRAQLLQYIDSLK